MSTTYKYIVIEPRAIRAEDDTEEYKLGVRHERALALAAPTLKILVEELMEEIKKLKTLGNEKLRWVTVPDDLPEDQKFIGGDT
jgi:hypothetical protein